MTVNRRQDKNLLKLTLTYDLKSSMLCPCCELPEIKKKVIKTKHIEKTVSSNHEIMIVQKIV